MWINLYLINKPGLGWVILHYFHKNVCSQTWSRFRKACFLESERRIKVACFHFRRLYPILKCDGSAPMLRMENGGEREKKVCASLPFGTEVVIFSLGFCPLCNEVHATSGQEMISLFQGSNVPVVGLPHLGPDSFPPSP